MSKWGQESKTNLQWNWILLSHGMMEGMKSLLGKVKIVGLMEGLLGKGMGILTNGSLFNLEKKITKLF